MATAIESVIECPICTLTFREPKILPCEHSFCKECIVKLTKSGYIDCPVCKRKWIVSDIKSDLRLIQFLDALAEKVEEFTEPEKVSNVTFNNLCFLCEVNDISYKCEECDFWICDNCVKGHKKISTTQNHRLSSLKQNRTKIVDGIKSKLQSLDNEIKRRNSLISKLEHNIVDVGLTKTTILSRATAIRNECKKEIDEFFDQMENEVSEALEADEKKITDLKIKAITEVEDRVKKHQEVKMLLDLPTQELITNYQQMGKATDYFDNRQCEALEYPDCSVSRIELTKIGFIIPNNIVKLSICNPDDLKETTPMQIFVKYQGHNSIAIICKRADTVADLKEQLGNKQPIPPERQKLIYGGKLLADEQQLRYYDLKKNATVFLSPRAIFGYKSNAPDDGKRRKEEIPKL